MGQRDCGSSTGGIGVSVQQRGTYLTDRQFADQFVSQQQWILGKYLLPSVFYAVAPPEPDQKRATDFVCAFADPVRVLARVRSAVDYARYGNQITIRSHRDNGTETELSKVIKGYGSHLLYGFDDSAQPGRLRAFVLADLAVFRAWYAALTPFDSATLAYPKDIPNGDGTWFRAFRLSELPEGFVLGRHKMLRDDEVEGDNPLDLSGIEAF